MNNSRPIVNISLLLGTIIAVSAFFLVFNNIPVQALHKEQQLLESFDDLADFAKAVKSGDEEIEEIPIQSMKAADIYDDADDNLKDCIDQAAEIGDSLTDREVVHCVDDVNYFNNKYSNSTVSTNATSTATTGLADTGADTTSTSNAADTTSTSNAADTTSTSNAADTTSTSNAADTTSTSNAADTTSTSNAADTTSTSNAADTTSTSNAADTTSTSNNSNENNLVDELVKTGKFTEAEAREFVSNNMQSGTGTDTTSDIKTSNADTNTADTETSNADTNTDSSASDDTSSSNNEDNNNQSSNNNSNNPEDYDDLNELVNDIKNGDVDTDKISLSAFQDSGAYQGADQETQDCIDLAGKIGNNLGDQEIVNCSEDPNFYRNEISNNNDNNADDSSNNADDSSNNADDSSNNADDSSNNADDSSNDNNN